MWFQRVQANDTLVQDSIWTGFVHQPPNVSRRHGEHLHVCAGIHAARLAFAGRRVLRGGYGQVEGPAWRCESVFRGEFTNGWNEANGRASNYVFQNSVIQTQPAIGASALASNNATFLPAPRIGVALVSVWLEDDRHSSGLRHLLCLARQPQLPLGPDAAVQYGSCRKGRHRQKPPVC